MDQRTPRKMWLSPAVAEWLAADKVEAEHFAGAMSVLQREGPALRRPLVGEVVNPSVQKLKELRTGTNRVLFVFDSTGESAVMLVAGDKTGLWNDWYPGQIAEAVKTLAVYEKALAAGDQPPGEPWRAPGHPDDSTPTETAADSAKETAELRRLRKEDRRARAAGSAAEAGVPTVHLTARERERAVAVLTSYGVPADLALSDETIRSTADSLLTAHAQQLGLRIGSVVAGTGRSRTALLLHVGADLRATIMQRRGDRGAAMSDSVPLIQLLQRTERLATSHPLPDRLPRLEPAAIAYWKHHGTQPPQGWEERNPDPRRSAGEAKAPAQPVVVPPTAPPTPTTVPTFRKKLVNDKRRPTVTTHVYRSGAVAPGQALPVQHSPWARLPETRVDSNLLSTELLERPQAMTRGQIVTGMQR